MIENYPLCWPPARPRARSETRKSGQFQVTFTTALGGLKYEIGQLGGTDLIVSSNLPMRKDGWPLASAGNPSDSGVAVYFTRKGKQLCFACDKYIQIAHNMRAIELTVQALRGIARWGTGDMMEAAFTGFQALPSSIVSEPPWRDTLRCHDAIHFVDVEACYRARRAEAHPDRGGSAEEFDRVQRAWEQAQAEFA